MGYRQEKGVVISDSTKQNNRQEAHVDEEKKSSRKRQRTPDKHQQNLAKKLRNSGKAYKNRKGNVVSGKEFKNINCNCPKKCCTLINEEERKIMFDNFWNMGNYSRQNAFLCGLIHQTEVHQRRPRNQTRPGKRVTYLYHLQKFNETVRVCKQFFLGTFCVSDGRVSRALAKLQKDKSPGEDLRGKQQNARKILDSQIEDVKKHISSFPAFQSHYTRKDNPQRKYLSPTLDVRKMYNLYKTYCQEKQLSSVKEHSYRYIFNTSFNLHFHTPRKDTCKNCDLYKTKISVEEDPQKKLELETQHEIHLRKAEKARESMKTDKRKAEESPDRTYTCTMDLQKALPFPVLTVSEAYYRRNMYCYNFGIHDIARSQAVLYVWDETIASRGSQEISSCLLKHFKNNAADKKHIILYSDACTGQNRNLKVALMLMKLTQDSNIEVIDHKFMTSGHSYLPNDSDFGIIEKAAKNRTMFVPNDWYEVMTTAKKKNKFILVRMDKRDFFSTAALEKVITKRKKDEENKDVNWLSIQWLRYEKNKPYKILYKYTLNTDIEFSCLNLKPTKPGRQFDFKNIHLQQLYNSSRVISNLKIRDMLYLLKYIPPVHHSFFAELKGDCQEDRGPLSSDSEEVE